MLGRYFLPITLYSPRGILEIGSALSQKCFFLNLESVLIVFVKLKVIDKVTLIKLVYDHILNKYNNYL